MHRSIGNTLLFVIVGAALTASSTSAQAPDPRTVGRIVGRVVDAATGQGIPDAGVGIPGSPYGVLSGLEGRFVLRDIPSGTVTLQVRRIGYQPKTVTGVIVAAGRSVEQDVAHVGAAVTLTASVVTAQSERGTVGEALDQQKISLNVVSAITAEQIAKSPDGDAAQTMQRVSGVSVQDGKYVFVRGLGDRYTTSQLNGARVPSPEPEKRVVPLDMFPAGLLQTITTTKTFTPDQQGDFSGATVDITTRDFPARRAAGFALSGGYHNGSTGTRVMTGATTGGEPFAMAGGARDLPRLFRDVGNFQGVSLTPGDKNLLISQFRNSWTPSRQMVAPNASGSASFGGNDPLLFGHALGYLVSATWSSSTDFKDNQVRALADRGHLPGETREIDRFTGSTASQEVLWGGLVNVSTMLGTGTRVSVNGIYNRTADNVARIENGSFENEGIRARITRMQYVERAIRSLQVSGEHQIGVRHRADWAATASGVSRAEPDRSEFVQAIERDTPTGPDVFRWLNSGNGGANRTFSSLNERSVESRANYQFTFTAFGQEHFVKAGALVRDTRRGAETHAYAISAPGLSNAQRELTAEELFDGRFSGAGKSVLDIAPLSQGGSYDAHDQLSAGYLMAELSASARLRFVGGVRFEADRLQLNAASTLGAPIVVDKHWNDLLPSVALNVKLSNSQQLRISASRTLARPEYRELSPITSRDVLNGDDTQGNEYLARTRITNADLRWEWYLGNDEVLSVALFAKRFEQPIERVYRAAGSGTRVVFFANAESADNLGIEIEARRQLDFITRALEPLSLFANVTIMRSEIRLGADTRASATNLTRAMVGQAPYVINGGLTYTSRTGSTTATMLFNRVGERIDAAGDSPLPDVVEQARNVVDASLRFPLSGPWSARIDAKNLLDTPHRTIQGTVVREAYRSGRTIQFGLALRP